jgi:hypothetical protein
MMLTENERATLRHKLIMDDVKPWKVWQLSDADLIMINQKNDEYMQRALAEALADNNPNRNKGIV